MMKSFFAAVITATTLVPGPAVQAHPTSHYTGGCGFNVVSEDDPLYSSGDRWIGALHVIAVATDAAGTPDPTALITVTCDLWVDGVRTDFSYTVGGSGPVAVGAVVPFQFEAAVDDPVAVCETVTINREVHAPASRPADCDQAEGGPLVPYPVQDVLTLVSDQARHLVEQLDPALCAAVALLAPGIPGIVDVDGDGDVDVLGKPTYVCPPY